MNTAMKNRILFRNEPGRTILADSCIGIGKNLADGSPIKYRGVDVSSHGFGCIIEGPVNQGDHLLIHFHSGNITFEVAWVESHLGIIGQHRVGLCSTNPLTDVEAAISKLVL